MRLPGHSIGYSLLLKLEPPCDSPSRECRFDSTPLPPRAISAPPLATPPGIQAITASGKPGGSAKARGAPAEHSGDTRMRRRTDTQEGRKRDRLGNGGASQQGRPWPPIRAYVSRTRVRAQAGIEATRTSVMPSTRIAAHKSPRQPARPASRMHAGLRAAVGTGVPPPRAGGGVRRPHGASGRRLSGGARTRRFARTVSGPPGVAEHRARFTASPRVPPARAGRGRPTGLPGPPRPAHRRLRALHPVVSL